MNKPLSTNLQKMDRNKPGKSVRAAEVEMFGSDNKVHQLITDIKNIIFQIFWNCMI